MATPFDEIVRSLMRRQGWGPFLIVVGAYLLLSMRLTSLPAGVMIFMGSLAAGLLLAGVLMMFYQLKLDEGTSVSFADNQSTEPEYIVAQLSKNYELLRRQTTQGFILAGIFMALGFVVILFGSAGALFGFSKEGSSLTTVAGVLMEFISGTSLLVYRLNFKRLNETTDKLDGAWRILTAHKLTQTLPEQLRGQATTALIQALLRPPQNDIIVLPNTALQPTVAKDQGGDRG